MQHGGMHAGLQVSVAEAILALSAHPPLAQRLTPLLRHLCQEVFFALSEEERRSGPISWPDVIKFLDLALEDASPEQLDGERRALAAAVAELRAGIPA